MTKLNYLNGDCSRLRKIIKSKNKNWASEISISKKTNTMKILSSKIIKNKLSKIPSRLGDGVIKLKKDTLNRKKITKKMKPLEISKNLPSSKVQPNQ